MHDEKRSLVTGPTGSRGTADVDHKVATSTERNKASTKSQASSPLATISDSDDGRDQGE
jgi:hypothetical protein